MKKQPLAATFLNYFRLFFLGEDAESVRTDIDYLGYRHDGGWSFCGFGSLAKPAILLASTQHNQDEAAA